MASSGRIVAAGLGEGEARPWIPAAMRARLGGALLVLLVGLITVGPIGFVVVNSFDVARPAEPWTFGLKGWIDGVFTSRATGDALWYSLILSVRAPLSVAIAFVIAWFLIRVQVPARRTLEVLLWFAFFLPSLPVVMGWLLLLGPESGLVNGVLKDWGLPVLSIESIPGIMWVHMSVATVPVMVLLLAPAFRMMDASMEEAARVCGSGNLRTVWRVTIPLLITSVMTALLAGMIRSLEAFEVEQILGTPSGIYVYATRIYDLIIYEPPRFPQAMALSTLVLGVLCLLAMAYQGFVARRSYATLTGRGTSARPLLTGPWRWWATIVLFAYVAVAVVLPLIMVVVGSFMRLFGFFGVKDPFTLKHWAGVLGNPVFETALLNSLYIGIGTGLLGLIFYTALGYVLARSELPGRRVIGLMSWLPWAVPGMLLSLGLLWLLLASPVLGLLYGNIGALLLALFIKELPLGVNLTNVAFRQVARELEHSARVCGASWFTTYRRIMIPLVAPTLLSVFVLTFISAIRDISTTILLVTPASRGLSVLMFEFANGSNFEGASVVGIIVTTIALGVALVSRRLGLMSAMR